MSTNVTIPFLSNIVVRMLEKLRQMILQYLKNAGNDGAKRDSIYEYLKDVLPQSKTEEQQLRYLGRLLSEMNGDRLIGRNGLKWTLVS